jgi:hypothetical protein
MFGIAHRHRSSSCVMAAPQESREIAKGWLDVVFCL